MHWFRVDDGWNYEDVFGRRWRLELTRPGGGGIEACVHQVAELRSLIEGAFFDAMRRDNRALALVLDIHAVTTREILRTCALGRWGDAQGLRLLEERVGRPLLWAMRMGALTLGRQAPVVWSPVEPAADTQPDPVEPTPEQTTWFELLLVDEVGAPITGIDMAFAAGGVRRIVSTDASGIARCDDVEVSAATASVASLAQLRDALRARWSTARAASPPMGPRVTSRELDGAEASLTLQSEELVTLVIMPSFHCHEISGAHFDFGRSFVRREALGALANLAEGLRGDIERRAMIWGHSDHAGTDLVNKELSERRAKALHALFTHDAAAWEELFSGTADGPAWKEKWGVLEAQHMLNALGVTDDSGRALQETGVRDAGTKVGIARFRTGDYPDRPAEQVLLPGAPRLGLDGRRELFLAYAKRISRTAIAPERFSKIGSASYMGCGEFNPLSISAQDVESRRAVVFVFDPAAAPTNLPCQLRSVGPCHSVCSAPAKQADPDGKPPYRCPIYQEVARRCPCQGGLDVSHDLVLQFPISLREADELSHVYVLESEDGTIRHQRTLASDARANERMRAELCFEHLPENHAYRLSCSQEGEDYVLIESETLAQIRRRFGSADAAVLDAVAIAAWLATTQEPALEEEDDT